ncbi:MAG: LytTR family transcriptional regulator [Firmicutes bacterium]|nr:LytTR family transcriptional regulator [Bacillota bacterium]
MNIALMTSQSEKKDGWVNNFREFLEKKSLLCQVMTYENYEQLTDSTVRFPWDIVFYDTYGLAEEEVKENLIDLRETFPECNIVICCEDERYALFGYSVRAFDYVMDMADDNWMKKSFELIVKEKFSDMISSFHVKIKGAWTKLDIKHICYMETFNHHIIFHMDNGKEYQRTGNFKDLATELTCSPYLFQCHKSYVVNGLFISEMTQESFLMKNGRKINISRPYRKASRTFYAGSISLQY